MIIPDRLELHEHALLTEFEFQNRDSISDWRRTLERFAAFVKQLDEHTEFIAVGQPNGVVDLRVKFEEISEVRNRLSDTVCGLAGAGAYVKETSELFEALWKVHVEKEVSSFRARDLFRAAFKIELITGSKVAMAERRGKEVQRQHQRTFTELSRMLAAEAAILEGGK